MVKSTLKPVRKATVVDGIIGQLKGLIRQNRFGDGRRLPSERDLAVQLGVSRPSVREAIRTLELMGVVDTRHGSGSQVADSGSNVLQAPFEFLLALDRPTIAHLHETRTLLEVQLAGRAAERRTEADLAAMEEALGDMRSRPGVTGPDHAFHQTIAHAAHNPILLRIMTSLSRSIFEMMDAGWPGVHDPKSGYKLHEPIFQAIRRRNERQATRAMAKHMEVTAEELRRAKVIA
jgi:GntR family transcriptional repressor for pyruvate dehydrogenase complex